MADWYCSSVAYAGYTAWVGSNHAYSIGDLVIPTAPALKAKWVMRCTTSGSGGTVEPTWPIGNNATVTCSGGVGPFAVFTNVTGQGTFFWTAAAGDLATITGRFAPGDRAFVSSDHTETQTTLTSYGTGSAVGTGYGNVRLLSVNRAGSTPPVAADLVAGATLINSSGGLTLSAFTNPYFYGFTFTETGTANIAVDKFGVVYLSHCTVFLNTASTVQFTIGSGNADAVQVLDNTTVQFGATGQLIAGNQGGFELLWQGTPNALPGAIFPTTLFVTTSGAIYGLIAARGVDFSAVTGTLVGNSGASASRYLFDSCKIASGVTRYQPSGVTNTRDVVELVNCFDGTNIISELYAPNGSLTTEFTITMSGGAADNVGAFSHKMVSNANIDKFVYPMCSFWMDVGNTSTGSSKTATVEIISSTTLFSDEIALYLEYMGTVGSSVTSFADSFAGPLVTSAAVTTSTATWNSSPATPQKQKLQVTFTPQRAGRVRGQVRVGKTSATVYVNPQITIT